MHTININKLSPRQALKNIYILVYAKKCSRKRSAKNPRLLYTVYKVVGTWVNKAFYCLPRIKGCPAAMEQTIVLTINTLNCHFITVTIRLQLKSNWELQSWSVLH